MATILGGNSTVLLLPPIAFVSYGAPLEFVRVDQPSFSCRGNEIFAGRKDMNI